MHCAAGIIIGLAFYYTAMKNNYPTLPWLELLQDTASILINER